MSVWNNQSIVDLVLELWDQGRTGTEIANTIEVRFKVLLTRNAVMSKLKRSGKLGTRGGGSGAAGTSKAQKEARRRKAVKTVAEKAAVVLPARVEPPPQGWFAIQNKPVEVKPYVEKQVRVFDPGKLVTFDQLDEAHHCKWPIGDPKTREFRFCGEAKVVGLPYCKDCLAVAFQPKEVAPPHGVTARPVSSAAGGQTEKIRPDVATDSVPAAGEALVEEMEEA